MTPRARVLIGSIAAALAWMLGYGMGGGFRIGGKGAADSPDDADVRGGGAAGRKAGLHDGTTHAADDTLSDQVAARRIPWTRERLLKAVGSVHHEPDQLHAIRFGMKLIEQLGAEDFPFALDALEEAIKGTGKPNQSNDNDMLRKKLREFAIMRWAELKPEAAGEYLKAQPYHRGAISYGGPAAEIAALCGVWSQSDPDAALKWAKTLPKDHAEQFQAKQNILMAIARRDVDAALALARADDITSGVDGEYGPAIVRAIAMNDPEGAARKMEAIGSSVGVYAAANSWAYEDHDAALKSAQDIPDEKIRGQALSSVWSVFAREHREQAAEMLSKLPADESNALAGNASTVASHMLVKDAEGAIRWAEALRNPVARQEAFVAIGEYYGREDSNAGVQWVNSLSARAERDKAISGFASYPNSQPQMRGDLAATIVDPELRRDTLRNLFSEWRNTSPAAATEWLRTSPNITDEDRQAILKKE